MLYASLASTIAATERPTRAAEQTNANTLTVVNEFDNMAGIDDDVRLEVDAL